MSTIKIIKNEQDYQDALVLIEELMVKDPEPNSDDGAKLDLLSTLVENYELKVLPKTLPDPIDAILFRMEQQNLKPADLIPYIGSRSKVSEILSRKRPLTLSMIRSLESGLGISGEVLLKETDEFRNVENITWTHFPLKEMGKRNYFGVKLPKIAEIKTAMENFFRPVESPAHFFGMLRKSSYRSIRPMNKHALVVWSTFIVKKAQEVGYIDDFKPGTVNLAFMQKVAKFSAEDKGVVSACEFLRKYGITVVVEPHFAQTYLDGATIMIDKKHIIIGLTLRLDHLDNFWFSLMHELAHIALHYNQNSNFFYDDLDSKESGDTREQEADKLAREALVPENKWENSPARLIPSPIAAESLAKDLGVHVAIVAGKMRYEGGKYTYLNTIINQARVRKYFPGITWPK